MSSLILLYLLILFHFFQQSEFKISEIKLGGPIMTMSISSNGKLLATWSLDGYAKVIDLTTGHIIRIIKHADYVLSVSITSDGKLLSIGSRDGLVRVVDLIKEKNLQIIKHDGTVESVSISSDGKRLALGS